MSKKMEVTIRFDKPPDPDYILSVLIDIYERQHNCKIVVEKSPPPAAASG